MVVENWVASSSPTRASKPSTRPFITESSISNSFINDLNEILESYHIKIIKYLDGNYVKNFNKEEIEISKMAFNILNGANHNEVIIIQKNTKKLGFFEKFFQLFS